MTGVEFFDIHAAAAHAAAIANENLARAVRETEATKERLRGLAVPAVELIVVQDLEDTPIDEN